MQFSLRARSAPSADDAATLKIRGLDPLAVRIDGSEDGAYALRLNRKAPDIRELHRQTAMIELPDRARHEGTIMAIEAKNRTVLKDQVTFLVDSMPPGTQKRQWTRVPVVIPVRVGFQAQKGDWREGWTVDLSAGGALIGGVSGARVTQTLRTQFSLPDYDTRILAVGAVIRVTHAGLLALRWTAIEADDRHAIAGYLNDEMQRILDRRYAS